MRLKALVLTNLFPNPQEPLRGIFVYQLVENLKNHCDLMIVSPLPWFPKVPSLQRSGEWSKFSQIPQMATMNGLRIYYPKFPVIPKVGFVQSLFLFLRIFHTIRSLHAEEQFDLVNAHWIFPDGVAAAWLCRILGLPLMLTAHGCDINAYTKLPMRRLQILSAIRSAQLTVVVSRQQKELIEKLGIRPSKMSIVQNGVDLDLLNVKDQRECRRLLHLDTEKKIILFIGQHVEVKGFTYLISAVKRLASKGINNFKVIAIGEGPLKKTLWAEVQESELEQHIEFVGAKKYTEIPFWLGASDLLCLPSHREGCPCVVLEALACGRPVVASKVGGIPDIINHDNGILIEPGNSESLSDGLMKALTTNWDAGQIQQSVLHQSWKHVAQRYYELMQGILMN